MNTDAITRFFAERIAQAFADGKPPRAVFAANDADTGELKGDAPPGVTEAWAFYKANVMDADWGTVGVYPVDASGANTLAVWTRDDGDKCWLEVYATATGTFIAAARSLNGKTVWMERDAARAQVFTGELPPELQTA